MAKIINLESRRLPYNDKRRDEKADAMRDALRNARNAMQSDAGTDAGVREKSARKLLNLYRLRKPEKR